MEALLSSTRVCQSWQPVGGVGALPDQTVSLARLHGRRVKKSLGTLSVSCQAGEKSANGAKVFKSAVERSRRKQEEANLLSEATDATASTASDLDMSLFRLTDIDFLEFVDNELRTSNLSLTSGKKRDTPLLPPKLCTLRAFGGGEGVMKANPDPKSVYELLVANIEAAAQVRNFERISGRLAMMAFFIAIGVEFLTGNSVFRGVDVHKLVAVAALCGVATVSAAGFAFAWRVKGHVVSLLSKGCQNMVDSAIDKVIDGLFFDEKTFQ